MGRAIDGVGRTRTSRWIESADIDGICHAGAHLCSTIDDDDVELAIAIQTYPSATGPSRFPRLPGLAGSSLAVAARGSG